MLFDDKMQSVYAAGYKFRLVDGVGEGEDCIVFVFGDVVGDLGDHCVDAFDVGLYGFVGKCVCDGRFE